MYVGTDVSPDFLRLGVFPKYDTAVGYRHDAEEPALIERALSEGDSRQASVPLCSVAR